LRFTNGQRKKTVMKKLTLGTYLKNARIKAGLSQIEVARRLKLKSPFVVLAWERNMGEALPLYILKSLVTLYDLNDQVVFDLILQYQLTRFEEKMKRLKREAL